MVYEIYRDKSCVLSLEEKMKGSEIEIGFTGHADGSYVVANYGDKKFFRKIEGGKIYVPIPTESATLHITYVENERPYHCTPVDVIVTPDAVLLHPNLSFVQEEINKLKEKADRIETELNAKKEEMQALKDKFAELYEGYNVI